MFEHDNLFFFLSADVGIRRLFLGCFWKKKKKKKPNNVQPNTKLGLLTEVAKAMLMLTERKRERPSCTF